MVKPAQLQWSRFSCGKNHCNSSVPVPTLTRNRSSGLEPLLTLIEHGRETPNFKKRQECTSAQQDAPGNSISDQQSAFPPEGTGQHPDNEHGEDHEGCCHGNDQPKCDGSDGTGVP